MTSLTVTGDAILGYRIEYNLTDESAIGDILTITRTDNSGHYPVATVRGADAIVVTSFNTVVYDYEAPFATTFTYLATRTSPAPVQYDLGTTAGPTAVPTGFALIQSALNPRTRSAGAVLDMGDWSREMRVLGEHQILGRSKPVLALDVLGSRNGTMSVANINPWIMNFDTLGPYAAYAVREDPIEDMFDDGAVFQFRSSWTTTGFDDCYFMCRSMNIGRLDRAIGSTAIAMKKYDIAFTEVDQPDTKLSAVPLVTWADVRAVRTTWADVAAANTTWANVLESP